MQTKDRDIVWSLGKPRAVHKRTVMILRVIANISFGKGHSTNILEEQIINQFKEVFLQETLPAAAEAHLAKLAVKRAHKKNTDPEDEIIKVQTEYEKLGEYVFSFDSGTTPAVKQMRHRLLMADAGAVNLEIDEIGSNLLANTEVLTTYLELFDVGKVKAKLTKNTSENTRVEEIDGRTPTNMMLYGTPNKLLNGAKEEQEFFSFQETGFARRCLFGYSRKDNSRKLPTPEEIYERLVNPTLNSSITELSDLFGELAHLDNFKKEIQMDRNLSIAVIAYKQQCEIQADALPEHMEMSKAEISHRYFKALKLAGAYAFVEQTDYITEDQWWAAVKLIEDSGEAFARILARDRNYVKLAKYIAAVQTEVTQPDLVEDLPFYKGTNAVKREMMDMAIAWGYKNNVIIKRFFNGTFESYKGEALQETNLDEMIISYSEDMACGYETETVPFDKLYMLTQESGFHWINHACTEDEKCNCTGHRKEVNMIPGFNMVVIDVDSGFPMALAISLLKEYTYHIYTTKSHTEDDNRYRIVMPISHTLKLDTDDYKEFMANVNEWLPIEVDESTTQRSRKWRSNEGQYFYNEGKLLDATLFIPKTTKNEERKQKITDSASLSNMERWFLDHTSAGDRNNKLSRYALMLADSGMDYDSVKELVLNMNANIPNPLTVDEVESTVLRSVARHIQKQ